MTLRGSAFRVDTYEPHARPRRRVAIYCRVSTGEQEKCGTIEAQVTDNTRDSKRANEIVVFVGKDEGKSATKGDGKLEARKDYLKILELVKRGEIDGVRVVDMSRLTRSEMLRDQYEILGPLQEHGVLILRGYEEIDLNTSDGRQRAGYNVMRATDEAADILRRTQGGKRELLARNGKPHGADPYGLRYIAAKGKAPGRWEIVEDQAAIIRECVERIIAGESCDRIAADLNLRGVPACRSGWGGSMVRSFVDLAWFRYAGRWRANKNTDDWCDVPRILSDEQITAAKIALTRARRGGLGKRITGTYALDRRVLKCGCCGAWIGVRSEGKGGRKAVYVCRAKRVPKGTPGRCTMPMGVNQPLADAAVYSAVVGRLWDADVVADAMGALRERGTDDQAAALDAVEKARALVLATEQRASAVAANLSAIPAEAVAAVLSQMASDRARAREALQAAEDQARATDVPNVTSSDIAEAVARLRAMAETANPAERRAIIRAMVTGGTMQPGGVLEISLGLPLVCPANMNCSSHAYRTHLGSVRIVPGKKHHPTPARGKGGRFRGTDLLLVASVSN